jgi:hypothetical protein
MTRIDYGHKIIIGKIYNIIPVYNYSNNIVNTLPVGKSAVAGGGQSPERCVECRVWCRLDVDLYGVGTENRLMLWSGVVIFIPTKCVINVHVKL